MWIGLPPSPVVSDTRWVARSFMEWRVRLGPTQVLTSAFLGLPVVSGSATHNGWIAGFGFEYALSNHVSTRIEYAHIDLGSANHSLATSGGTVLVTDFVDLKMDTIRLGVNIKLY